MTFEEKEVVQLMFKNKIYQKCGDEFQNFFEDIMGQVSQNFKTVKPEGSIGDRKNDGFNFLTGQFYQVYAPENINCNIAINKINTDFLGLLKYWNSICPIKEFNFVLNDKYKGAYPPIYRKLLEIKKAYDIDTKLILSKDLEDAFLGLEDEKIYKIIGTFSRSNINIEIKYSALDEVINHILNTPYKEKTKEIISPARLENKLYFNNLNEEICRHLNYYSMYTGTIENYFINKGNFEEEKIQKKLISIYEKSKEVIPDSEDNCSSLRFFYMIDKISPNSRGIAIESAIYLLLVYYIEFCDIFENPNYKEE